MRKWLALLIFCSCASSLAFAQSAEISVSGGVSRFNGDYATAGGGDNTPIKFTNGFRLVFRFTWNQGKFFSHEVGYGYARSHLHYQSNPVQDIAAISLHQGLYNFLINATPEGSRVRPFATGGVHFTSFYPPGASVYGGSVTKFGVNYGAGIKIRVAQNWQVRFDIRQYETGKPSFGGTLHPSGRLLQDEISVGVGFVL